MPLPNFLEDMEIITKLSNNPNDDDGLGPDELKFLYDKAGILIKTYINEELLPELESAIASAARGISQQGIPGNVINNGTINADKLVQTPGFETVITEAIRDLAITRAKIALKAVGSAQIDDYAVINQNIANKAVSENKLDDALRDKINRIITEAMLDTSLKDKINSHQKLHKEISVTLNAGATSWSVSATGVTATNSIVVSAAPASYTLWRNHGIRCTGQGVNTLTFAADTAPASAVTANVLIFD